MEKYASYQSEILIVAGGGGGGCWGAGGGDGGGTSGDEGSFSIEVTVSPPAGGSQTTGYAFGKGQKGCNGVASPSLANSNNYRPTGGGGGGWYGGYAFQKSTSTTVSSCSGAGGSGYVGGVTDGDMESGLQAGDGKAKITLVAE